MDEKQLAKKLDAIKAPAPDETRRKQALGAAMAAFDENISKNPQGYGADDSLTAMEPKKGSNNNGRRFFMQKTRSFSGMTGAVALCALVAVLGSPFIIHEMHSIIGTEKTALDASQLALSSTSGFSAPEPRQKTVVGKTSNDPIYKKQLEVANKKRAEEAAKHGGSSIGTPLGVATSDAVALPPPPVAANEPMRAQAEMQRAPALSNEGMAGKPQQQGATLRMDDSLAAAPAEKERGEKDKGFARKRDKAVAQNAVEAKKSESVMMKAMPSASMPAPAKEPSLAGGAPAPMQVMPAPGVAMPVSPPVVVERYRQPYYQQAGRDAFPDYKDNGVMEVASDPVSTFSIDVDTSSYSFLRRSINEGHLPPRGAVRLEEMINYFHYNYKVPEEGADPFLPNVAVFDCPWRKGDKIVDIGIKGYEPAERPKSNIVFLIDTSGSMNSPDKLPLLVSSFKLMLDSLKPDDTVGIVTYAGHAGVALEPTPASDKVKILSVLDNLYASGSTAGAQGIQSAYQLAEQAFIKGGNNRILLATDGDFNVGVSSQSGLKDLITRERDKGIYLSVLGFGTGNYQDTTMQTLAQNGNGNASYIDNLSEARKVLVDEASSTLFTIAKDVKIQVEFNPKTVQEYRLLGYETRHLNREDFNNDKIDAGEVGAGHAVTAIYEITPVGAQPLVDKLRYGGEAAQKQRPEADADDEKAGNVSGEYAFLKIRYKKPDADTSTLMTRPITPSDERPFAETSDDVRFATAVAGFGQLLRGSNYIGNLSYDQIIEMASHAKGADEDGYRAEFVNLVKLAKSEAGATTGPAEGGGDGDEPVEPGPVPMIQK